MTPTLKDVAARAGVSPSAVSRTFSRGSVSREMRARVEKAAAELGYHPNALASSLTTGRTMLVGLVVSNFRNPIFLDILDRATQRLQAAGLRPLLVNLSNETDPAESVRMMRGYSVDGVVIASSTLPPSFADAVSRAGLPVVHAFGRASAAPRQAVVGIDNVECGRLAARALAARGHRRVAFLGGPEGATSTQDRLEGFAAEAAARGMAAARSFAATYSFRAGHDEMRRLLEAGPPAEAYFCGDDVVAIGALSALRGAGLRVPGDVGVMGLNDMEMAGWETIDLTTIAQPYRQIVDASVEEMIARLADPARLPTARVFPCRIVERGTLRPMAD